MQSVSDIRQYFIDELAAENFVTDKTGVKTIELVGASFHADEPTIFGKLNDDYIKRELAWYKSKSLNVNDIPGKTPKIWKMVADKDGYINSNYGWCIWSDEIDSSDTVMRNKGRHNHGQYWHVYNELSNNRDSRRAVMIYTRPTMHEDYNRNGMSDFMCTNAVQYLIRDDVLNAIVQMRSNDVVFGYRNDFAWQDYVASLLETALRCDGRKIIWNVGSLHVYERHFSLVE
jgi:thymidylate synthase